MTSETNTRWSIGKLLISLVAIFTAISPYLADWNETHIYNPLWTPHAKFHNAQTMVLGAFPGLLVLPVVETGNIGQTKVKRRSGFSHALLAGATARRILSRRCVD